MHFLFFCFCIQLTTASFLRLFGLEKASQIETYDTCIDSDIHDVCLTNCRLQYLECLASCNDSSYCESQCRLNFASCDASCPCGVDCPLGCERCDHPLCDDCKDAEISNDDYKMCVVFALDKQNDCIKQCPPNLNCMDQCYADYRINVQSCPCIESENLTTTGHQYPTKISTTYTNEINHNANYIDKKWNKIDNNRTAFDNTEKNYVYNDKTDQHVNSDNNNEKMGHYNIYDYNNYNNNANNNNETLLCRFLHRFLRKA